MIADIVVGKGTEELDRDISPVVSAALSPAALSPAPTPAVLQVVDFEDMMVIDNNLDLLQMEPIPFFFKS